MKTKGQKRKTEQIQKKLRIIFRLCSLILMIFSGIIYCRSVNSDTQCQTALESNLSIETYKNSDAVKKSESHNKAPDEINLSNIDLGLSVEDDTSSKKMVVNKYTENNSEINSRNTSEKISEKMSENASENSKVIIKININTANIEQLCTLKGIGSSKAKSIIKYRELNGLYDSIEDIMSVPGIKSGVFEKIKDNICVNDGG